MPTYNTSSTDIARIKYFDGQILHLGDFQDQQQYHRNLRRIHNCNMHTSGIVRGLELSVSGSTLTVTEGMAIDCYGNEIYLRSGVSSSSNVSLRIDDLPSASVKTKYIAIKYSEREEKAYETAEENDRIIETPLFDTLETNTFGPEFIVLGCIEYDVGNEGYIIKLYERSKQAGAKLPNAIRIQEVFSNALYSSFGSVVFPAIVKTNSTTPLYTGSYVMIDKETQFNTDDYPSIGVMCTLPTVTIPYLFYTEAPLDYTGSDSNLLMKMEKNRSAVKKFGGIIYRRLGWNFEGDPLEAKANEPPIANNEICLVMTKGYCIVNAEFPGFGRVTNNTIALDWSSIISKGFGVLPSYFDSTDIVGICNEDFHDVWRALDSSGYEGSRSCYSPHAYIDL